MNRWNAFLVLIFLLPLPYGLVPDWAWTIAGVAVFTLLALELRGLLSEQSKLQLESPNIPIAFDRATVPLVLIWGVQFCALIQWYFFSLSPFDSLMSLPKGFFYAGLFTLALLMINTQKRTEQVVWAVVLAAGFQAMYGSVMTLTGLEYGLFIQKEHYKGVATGTYVNRNHLAGYLELAIALGVGLLLAQTADYKGSVRQRLRQFVRMLLSSKVLLRLLLAILVIALVLTRSRMGNTAFFASLMVTGAIALFMMRNKTKSTTILLGSLLIIDIAIVGTFFGVEKVAERLQSTSSQTESRDEVTRDTLKMFKSYPISGVGAGAFTHVYPVFKGDDVRTPLLYQHAHNDYAQFLAEFGLPASFALFVMVLWSLRWGISAMRQRNSQFYQGVGFACTMAIIAIGIHSMVDFNLQIPANAATFVLILALAAVARWTPHSSSRRSTSGRRRRRRKHGTSI
ncbi:O-antigen ligase family protein [Thalassolituus sp.]|uniref:O-antigen ligase family protein n=1 Tax=Thalassolituus sp. TaxID=2030822 RepID=UPI0035157DB5